MRGWAAAVFLMLASVFAAAAPTRAEVSASDWIYAATDDDIAFYVSPTTVRRFGPYVTTWILAVPAKDRRAGGHDLSTAFAMVERVDDCGRKVNGIRRMVDLTKPEAEQNTFSVRLSDVRFRDVPRKGPPEVIARLVCDIASRLPAISASLPLDSIAETEWEDLNIPSKTGARFHLLKSDRRSGSGWFIGAVRIHYPQGGETQDIGKFSTVVRAVGVDCGEGEYAVSKEDFYDEIFLASWSLDKDEELTWSKPEKGTTSEALTTALCEFAGPAGPSSGTAWLAESGYLVTASHVIEGARQIKLFQDGREVGAAEVVRDDPANDVAILRPKFQTAPYTPLKLKAGPAMLGTRVVTLGYPLADELGYRTVRLASGDVSALTGVDTVTGRGDDARLLQISVPVQGGNSGGPVIDDTGAVIGIIVSKKSMSDDEIVQNVNFALKSAYVGAMIADLPPLDRRPGVRVTGATSEIAAVTQRGVFLVVASGGDEPIRLPTPQEQTATSRSGAAGRQR